MQAKSGFRPNQDSGRIRIQAESEFRLNQNSVPNQDSGRIRIQAEPGFRPNETGSETLVLPTNSKVGREEKRKDIDENARYQLLNRVDNK